MRRSKGLVRLATLAVGLAALLSACGGGSSDSQDAGATTQSATTTTVEESGGEDAIVVEQSGLKPGKDLTSYGAVFKNTSDKDAHDIIVTLMVVRCRFSRWMRAAFGRTGRKSSSVNTGSPSAISPEAHAQR